MMSLESLIAEETAALQNKGQKYEQLGQNRIECLSFFGEMEVQMIPNPPVVCPRIFVA